MPFDAVAVTEVAAAPKPATGAIPVVSAAPRGQAPHPVNSAHNKPFPPARNVVFLSPQFPSWVTPFAVALGRNPDVNVLGIGDQPYETLPEDLRHTLTEYYKVDSMEDYDSLTRAVGFFTHKYGKVDRFESLNEHWLELEARIRTDFNIAGPKVDFIDQVRRKSLMKNVFAQAGVPTIQGTVATSLEGALDFTKKAGYPVVVKPDSGAGAASTYKASNDTELSNIFAGLPANTGPVVVEQYMDAYIISFDGLVDADGNIIFECSCQVDQSIMDVVNTGGNAFYVCLPAVPDDIREAGSAIVRAYGLRERFFHIELFKRRDNGKVVGLEINLRPPGAWMTDGYNYALSTDVYARWAAMVAGKEQPHSGPERYYAPYASRKNFLSYQHDNHQIREYLGNRLAMYKIVEQVLRAAAGDEAYISKAATYNEAIDIVNYIQARA